VFGFYKLAMEDIGSLTKYKLLRSSRNKNGRLAVKNIRKQENQIVLLKNWLMEFSIASRGGGCSRQTENGKRVARELNQHTTMCLWE
jgi:hypothetical protein